MLEVIFMKIMVVGSIFYLTTHTAAPELPEIRNAYHSVWVSLLLSVDVFFCFTVVLDFHQVLLSVVKYMSTV